MSGKGGWTVPGVFECGDFRTDTRKLLPQDTQCPSQEDGVDLQSQAEGMESLDIQMDDGQTIYEKRTLIYSLQ